MGCFTSRIGFVAVVLTAVVFHPALSETSVSGGDWPQYRFDAQRSAASPHPLPERLQLQWVRLLPPPAPAFPDEPRLRYDDSYEPIVWNETLLVGSMVTDSITAYDVKTGRQRWVFFTDAPVRFAPVAARGKVYAASDDGFLYCLDGETGRLVWKFRGLPEGHRERKVLGHQRLMSLHPVRGGPLLAEGVIYFAAGIWPQDGVFIHALDAETGEVLWSNTTSEQIAGANMDHGISQYAGLTPQGYLARVHDKLVVPCGAQLPAFLEPATGKLACAVEQGYTMGWGGRVGLPKGSWFAAGSGKYLLHSGDLYDITRPSGVRTCGSVPTSLPRVTRLTPPISIWPPCKSPHCGISDRAVGPPTTCSLPTGCLMCPISPAAANVIIPPYPRPSCLST